MSEKAKRFYTKEWSKSDFFSAVAAMASGEEVEDEIAAKIVESAEVELGRIQAAAEKKGSTSNGEKKDRLDSDYCKAAEAALVPLLTKEFQTTQELIDQATAKGILAPTGKPFHVSLPSQKLASLPNIVVGSKIVEAYTKDGRRNDRSVKAFKLA